MKVIYNRFSIIPHTCSKCEKAFWLEPYKHYKVERCNMFGTVEYVTNICKECVISELKGDKCDNDHDCEHCDWVECPLDKENKEWKREQKKK